MLSDALGPAQIGAALILLQRGLEEVHSRRNTRRLLQAGAHEEGRDFYPVVATTHLCWIASLAFLIPPSASAHSALLTLYLLLQLVRYWVIGTLGRYWTHRIIVLPGAPLVRRGPYRLMPHPNYVVTIVETLLLPLAFGAPALAAIFTVMWGSVLQYKIRLEDRALASRRAITVEP